MGDVDQLLQLGLGADARLDRVEVLGPVAVVAGVLVAIGAGAAAVGVVERRGQPQRVHAQAGEVAVLDLLAHAREITALVVGGRLEADRRVVARVAVGEAIDHDEVHDRVAPVDRGGLRTLIAVGAQHRVHAAVAVGRAARVGDVLRPHAIDHELVEDDLLVAHVDGGLPLAADVGHRDAGGPAVVGEVAVQPHAGGAAAEGDRGGAARLRVLAGRERIGLRAVGDAGVDRRIVVVIPRPVLGGGAGGQKEEGDREEDGAHETRLLQGMCHPSIVRSAADVDEIVEARGIAASLRCAAGRRRPAALRSATSTGARAHPSARWW